MAIPQDLLRSEELIYFRHANGLRILLQAIGCYCYWLSSVSLSIQADTIVCILRALQHSLYPPTSNRREGRCWQRLEDRWWWVVGLRTGKIGAALWARSRPCSYEGETNWSDSDKWTISASPTASFMSLKLLSRPQSLPCTPPSTTTTIFFLSALNPYSIHSHLPCSFFSASLSPGLHFYFSFVLPAMLFHFSHHYLPHSLFALLLEKYWRFLHLKRSCCLLLCSNLTALFSSYNW